jgi:hypothetical protein
VRPEDLNANGTLFGGSLLRSILTIDRIVFVSLDEDGHPAAHGHTEITYERDRIPAPAPAAGDSLAE